MIDFDPCGDRIMIKITERPDMLDGICIPDVAQHKPLEGVVVKLGSGAVNKNGDIVPFELEIGDRVIVPRFAGTDVELDGEKFAVLYEREFIAVVDEEVALDFKG